MSWIGIVRGLPGFVEFVGKNNQTSGRFGLAQLPNQVSPSWFSVSVSPPSQGFIFTPQLPAPFGS